MHCIWKWDSTAEFQQLYTGICIFVFVFYFSGYNSITQINNLQGLQTITTLDTEIQNTKQPRRITQKKQVKIYNNLWISFFCISNKIYIFFKSWTSLQYTKVKVQPGLCPLRCATVFNLVELSNMNTTVYHGAVYTSVVALIITHLQKYFNII